MKKNIWTIGHSNHGIEEFIVLLQSCGIKLLADIRRFPGSRKFPHFNKPDLQASLSKVDIEYRHFEALGGRRKPIPDSHNDRWQNDAFKGYADYMETNDFKEAIESLKEVSDQAPTAIMCSEAKWWQCHRSLVSDYLKAEGWLVLHIMTKGKAKEHPFSPAARMIQGKLDYSLKNDELGLTKDEKKDD